MQPGYRSILHDAQKKLEAASKEMDDIKPLLQELSREIDLSLPAARPQKNDENEIIHKEPDRKERSGFPCKQ